MRFYTNVQLVGNDFLVRGHEDGENFLFREKYNPTLFVLSNKKTEYKTLDGKYVVPINPGTVKDCREYYKEYQHVENYKIYGNNRFIYQYISDNYPENEIHFDISKIKIFTIDIEVASENGFPTVQDCCEELLTITIQDYATKEIVTWGCKPFNVTKDNSTYILCNDEADLFRKFIYFWENNFPDVVTGWNCSLYDMPYICRRISRILGESEAKRLSPWKLLSEKEIQINHKDHIISDIGGVTILDYIDLYKKFTYVNRESYRLDHIAEVELGQKKLDHSEYDTFKDFYTNNWQKYVEYNIIDVELVDRLEDKLKLIELAITLAYDAKVNFADVFYQVTMWDSIIYNYLKKKGIVIPPRQESKKDEKYKGAYVKEPIPGKYDWVVSFDLNSLYPHLIMQYNISPETLVETRHPSASIEKILSKQISFENYSDYCVCPNGSMYRKDLQGFLPELMQKIYNERVIYKKKMIEAKKKYAKEKTKDLEKEIARYNNIQMARKIQLNSAYGAIGNQYFRYYKLENAEAITSSGQVSIRWIENKMNQYLNKVTKTEGVDYVIASDTDSLYLNLGPMVEAVYQGREKTTKSVVSFLDKICKMELEKYIESSYQELADYLNAYQQKMSMKRENIAERGIWTGKKRYALNVWDSEGVRYEEPELKIMGLEAIKSSTPSACRGKIKDAIRIMMTGTESQLIKFISDFKDEFSKIPLDQISFPRSVNEVSKFKCSNSIYTKKTPIAIRGALLFNYLVNTKKLTNKYSYIGNGEKIKFCYLKMPNPIHENVISYIQELPKEFKLDNYIDYNLQFSKAFLDPIKSILECIGWNYEKQTTLDSLFN
jgi:DNA polymerase elongation subunit (family B)